MGPKLRRVSIFFGSHVLRIAAEDYYVLSGWNSCARFLTRTLGSLQPLEFFLMELLRKMPHQNIRLDRVLSDSGQHCVDLSPIKNCNFGWGPSFIESPSSLFHMFYDLQRKITCCSDGTLAQDASPEPWAR